MKKVLLSLFLSTLFSAAFVNAQHVNEVNTMATPFDQITSPVKYELNKAPFDLEFQWSVADTTGGASLTGVAWTGSEFWISQWNADSLRTLNPNGTFNSSFVVTGVANTRSLTWDGTNLYSGSASDFIYEINPTTKTLTNTINLPVASVGARMCAYDPTADNGNGGFWIGNFTSNIELYDRNGGLLTSIPQASHGIQGIYGGAVDTATAGGPYLLVYAQDGPGDGANKIYWIHIPTETNTGIFYNINNDLAPADSGIAGGLFVATDIIVGEQHILSLTQGAKGIVSAYELGFVPALSAFDLVSPSSGTRLAIDNGSLGSSVTIDWDAAVEPNGSPVTYEWLLDAPGGDFSAPLATIPSDNAGQDIALTLTIGAIDTLVTSLGVGEGDSIDAIWTVRATSTPFSLEELSANGPFDLKIVRDVMVIGLNTSIASEVSIFPNPSNGVIMINDRNNIVNSVVIVDLVGSVVKNITELGTKTQIDLNEYSKGVYLVRLNTIKGMYTQKLIVE
jgi:hypothetical protein